MKQIESTFKTHRFTEKLSGQALYYRILRMQDSLFIYIGNSESETFDGLGAAFISNQTKEAVGTSIVNVETTESQDLALKLSARLNKPVFVSSNTNTRDRMTSTLIEQRLVKEIKEFPEYF